jgi:gliding motility-associated-like protein
LEDDEMEGLNARWKKNGILLVFSVLLFAAVPQKASATHIVGGELNYVYLGNDSLYIKIKVYRDSLNADPYFDSPLSLYVYDSTNTFVGSYQVQLPDEADIVPQIDDSCFVEPPNVLVDFVIYEDTLYIPGLTPGYTLAYMRCCRNNGILNIEALDFITQDTVPGELTGAIYPAELPADLLDNGNPEFNTFPPLAICANKMLEYDHSATDPDGDSLVYSLCAPFTGGNAIFVFGDPILQAPPFQEVLFIPPFSLDNAMGGIPLDIDPVTGLLTAVPNTLGRFVIAVCVDEYRDGDFLDRHRRDFQFNVVDCSRVFDADFTVSPAPKIDTLTPFEFLFCDTTLTKEFTAVLMETIPVFWDFGDGTTSSEMNPVHTFPDTGRYDVMIVAGPGEVCADTMIKTINVQRHIIGAAFDFEQDDCGTVSSEVSFTDVSTASEPIVQWEWDFGDGATSGEQDPTHFYTEADTFDVGLLIYASNGCCTRTEEVVITTLLDSLYLPDTIATCDGDSVLITLEAGGNNDYTWTPSGSLSDPFAQQPLAFPESNTLYFVSIRTITASGDTCTRMDSCVVLVEDIIPDIIIAETEEPCSTSVSLAAGTDFAQPVDWLWSSGPAFTDTLSVIDNLVTTQTMLQATYYAQASSYWCSNTVAYTVNKSFIFVDVDPVTRCADGEGEVRFSVVNPPGESYTVTWTFEDTSFIANEPFQLDFPAGNQLIGVNAVNSSGCTADTSAMLTNFPLPVVGAVAVPSETVAGQTVELFATEDADYQYVWSPEANLSDPSLFNPVAEVFETTLFEVLVVDENGCESSDTALVVIVDVECDEDNIFIPNAFSPNGDGLNDIFRLTGERIESVSMVIYDRWGNRIFHADDAAAAWDGRADGQLMPADSYGYLVTVLCAGNATFRIKGNVTLIR